MFSSFVDTRRSFASTSKHAAIWYSVSKPGCAELVHHLLIVAGSFPSCSASHLLVFFFSARTTLSRLKSFSFAILLRFYLLYFFDVITADPPFYCERELHFHCELCKSNNFATKSNGNYRILFHLITSSLLCFLALHLFESIPFPSYRWWLIHKTPTLSSLLLLVLTLRSATISLEPMAQASLCHCKTHYVVVA